MQGGGMFYYLYSKNNFYEKKTGKYINWLEHIKLTDFGLSKILWFIKNS